MALQFESGVQNIVYQLDAGPGRKVIQAVLFVLFAFALAALYTFANFQGMVNPRAMEEAQVARNFALHNRLATQCIRPYSLGLVAERTGDGPAALQAHPDLLHPPAWPVVLATIFRLGGVPRTGVPTTAQVYGGDYIPVYANHFFTALAGLWVWLIGRKLFDRRVGSLSAGAFLVSDLVWRQSVQGEDLGLALFLGLGAVYFALWAADRPSGTGPEAAEPPAWRWLVPLVLSAGFTAAAFLTRYAAGCLALLVFLYIGGAARSRSWLKAGLYFVLAFLPVVPWLMRNAALSGHAFGLVYHQLLADTYLFAGDALARSLNPELPDLGARLYAVQIKMVANLRQFLAEGFGFGGAGILLGLCGAMYFHRFVRTSSRTLRWCLLPAAALMILCAAAFGRESLRALALLWPLAIIYGWAFFLVLLDRLQFEVRFLATLATAAVMFLTGLPLLLNVLPPRTGQPYPPYVHRYIGWVATLIAPDECLTTDIPWAVAWYGGKTAILLPRNIDGFYEIEARYHKIALAYFTTVTRDQPWLRGLSDPAAPEYTWYQVFAAGKVPGNFPLTHGRFLSGISSSDQLILADRQRW